MMIRGYNLGIMLPTGTKGLEKMNVDQEEQKYRRILALEKSAQVVSFGIRLLWQSAMEVLWRMGSTEKVSRVIRRFQLTEEA